MKMAFCFVFYCFFMYFIIFYCTHFTVKHLVTAVWEKCYINKPYLLICNNDHMHHTYKKNKETRVKKEDPSSTGLDN